jgi:hypothetical protein
MANVRSKTFLSLSTVVPVSGGLALVPSGVVWLVKEIIAELPFSAGFTYQGAQGFSVSSSLGVNIFDVRPALVGYPYIQEARVVLQHGDGVLAECIDAFWQLTVSGYELLLP